MLLALDLGNTNLTAGLFDGAELVGRWRMATRRDATGDELGVFLCTALNAKGFNAREVNAVALCSVVPPLIGQVEKMAREYFGVTPLNAATAQVVGLRNAYEDPRAVGADRLVNGLAAWKKATGTGTPRAVVVADFGTATTVDAVSPDGTYLGGAIAPGIGISSDALFRAAAKLPRVELVPPSQTLATNTAESIQAGLVFGYAGLTKELVARCVGEIESRFGARPAVYATGGLAELIAPLVPDIDSVEPDLTLRGLQMIWQSCR